MERTQAEMIADAMMARERFGADSGTLAAESVELIALARSFGDYWPRVILLLAGTLDIAVQAARIPVPPDTPEPSAIEAARKACEAVCGALGPMLGKSQPTAQA